MSTRQVVAVEGDITTLAVDAIVNAANSKVRGGGGVDGAIHAAGGPRILEDCRRRFQQGLATGDAGATTAGDLPCRWVIHAVGPNRHRGQDDPALLVSAYRRSFEVVSLSTLATERQSGEPALLGAFQRWSDPAWRGSSPIRR